MDNGNADGLKGNAALYSLKHRNKKKREKLHENNSRSISTVELNSEKWLITNPAVNADC